MKYLSLHQYVYALSILISSVFISSIKPIVRFHHRAIKAHTPINYQSPIHLQNTGVIKLFQNLILHFMSKSYIKKFSRGPRDFMCTFIIWGLNNRYEAQKKLFCVNLACFLHYFKSIFEPETYLYVVVTLLTLSFVLSLVSSWTIISSSLQLSTQNISQKYF